MSSYDVLLIVVSVAFIISMIVWIIVGLLVIQVIKKVKSTTEKAQQVAENVEAFTASLKSAGKATAIGAIVKQFTKTFIRRDK